MPDKKSKSKHSAANKESASLDHNTPAPEDTLASDSLEPETARPQFQVVEEAENLPETERHEPLEPQETSASGGNPQRSSMANPYQTSGFTNEAAGMTDPNPNQSAQHDFRFNREPQRKFPWWIVIIVLALALIGVGAWKFFFASPQEPQNQPSVTDILVEPPTTSSPSPSPETQELKRKDIKVQVLNGSGVVGSAGELAKVLESAGFESVDVDNAQNYDYTGITIQVKEGEDGIGKLIESDLEDDYEDIDIEDTLDADSEFDAVVIRGSQPGDEDILGAQDEVDESTEDTEATDSGAND